MGYDTVSIENKDVSEELAARILMGLRRPRIPKGEFLGVHCG
jgi:hypothetical protein